MYADGVESEVIYDVNSRKLLYVEKGICKEIEDLSAGYQSILSLIIDLAYRISVLNPDIGDNIRIKHRYTICQINYKTQY